MKERENEVLATETGDRKRRQRQSTLTKQTNKKKKKKNFPTNLNRIFTQ